MSEVKPPAVSAAVRAGRSPCSQRGDDALSGRITQAFLALAGVVAAADELLELLLHDASSSAAAAAAAAINNEERFDMLSRFLVRGSYLFIVEAENVIDDQLVEPFVEIITRGQLFRIELFSLER